MGWQFGRMPERITEDRAAIAFAFGGLYAIGATLLLITLLLPGAPDRSLAAMLTAGALAYGLAGLLLTVGARLPVWALRGVPAIGSLLIAGGLVYAGTDGAAAYGLYFFWVALSVSYFFELRIALLHIAFAVIAFGAATAFGADTPTPAVYAAVLIGTLSVVLALVVVLRSRMDRLIARLEDAARTDSLTGVGNRRAFDERFEEELQRALRRADPLGLVVIDLDGFKRLNDRLGHQAGDEALVAVAALLESGARTIDTVARVGGEEFGVLLPGADAGEGLIVAERLRRSIEDSFDGWSERVTGSCGVAAFPTHGATALELLSAADDALYVAKEGGRNRSAIARRHRPPRQNGDHPEKRPGDGRLAALLAMADEVDRRKGGRIETWRVGLYAAALAREVGMAAERAEQVRLAARLHDVGKISIGLEVLSAAKSLAEEEWQEIKRHPEIGARMLEAAGLDQPGAWVLGHHERLDGSGYPMGLAEDDIPLEARIVSVAEAYAAMQAPRPYRPPLPPEIAQRELQDAAGSQFDPELVDALLRLREPSVG